LEALQLFKRSQKLTPKLPSVLRRLASRSAAVLAASQLRGAFLLRVVRILWGSGAYAPRTQHGAAGPRAQQEATQRNRRTATERSHPPSLRDGV